ncbi:AAA family ATPase [Staphylococcus kloosii]|uniref:AAA family ATPase n=1 Tax=Staphylococcus kloosii TaxID=29384 RepID=UPI001E37B41B|nr:AAA family ATPase [Staphylococcus kloosii]MCD8879341.1 AAA family ATPase [Staphylococcus kloosii]
MLNKLENVSYKSFNNYSSKDYLTKINIFFGRNGSGKSSLSEWLSKQENEKCMIFNSKYLKDNIEEVEEIDGVRLVIGEEFINYNDQIKNLTAAINNLDNFINRKNNEIIDSKEKIFNKMTITLNEARERFKIGNNIVKQKKNAEKDPIAAFRSWEIDASDIVEEITIDSLDELENRIISSEAVLNNMRTPILDIDYNEFHEIVELLMKDVIKPTSNVSYKVSEWLKEGLEVHNMYSEKGTCEFCGNEFFTKVVKEKIDLKIKNEFSNMIEKINVYKEKVNNSLENMENIEIDIDTKNYLYQKKQLNHLLKILKDKEENSSKQFEYSVDNWESINLVDSIIKNYIEKLKKEIHRDKKIIDSISDFVKSWIGKKLKGDNDIQIEISNINNNTKLLEEVNECKNDNANYIRELEIESSNLKPFSDIVNSRFKILDINIKLDPNVETNSYNVLHSITKEKLNLFDLSEGEKRLIGFLHFYYNLFMIANSEMKENIEYIIVDDPITSLDTENRYHLTKVINQFIDISKSANKQVFVFTHSSFDFHNFSFKGKKNTNDTSHWYIEKNEGCSEIIKLSNEELSNYSDYYKSVFNEVMSFAIKGKNKVNKVDNYIKFANKIRFVLESHARSHYKIEYATTASIDELVKNYSIPNEKVEVIKESLDVINSLSHGVSFIDDHYNELSVIEVQEAIRNVIGIIYNKDNQHVYAICSEVLNKENKTELEKW